MRISPAPASAASVNRLRSQITANERRQASASAANARAIRQLGAAQRAAVAKLTSQVAQSDKALTKRILDGDAALDKRIAAAVAKLSSADGDQGRKAMRLVKRQQKRALWNSILLATSMPFFAAYGDVNDPFSRDNLILTGSLVGWMLGDEIVDKLLGDKKSPMLRAGSNFWSYAAPVGNAATVYYLMKDRQHHRFITGVSEIAVSDLGSDKGKVTIEIAEDSKKDFSKFADKARVVASLVSATDADIVAVTATIEKVSDKDDCRLVFTPLVRGSQVKADGTFKVAWMVDTKDPEAD
jgi:hypothetical protein